MTRKIIALFFLLLPALLLRAQDPHFSQYYTQPQLLNPAATGYFSCDYRLTADYRSQWVSVPVPYNTFTASADMRVVNGHGKKNIIGVGFFALSDKAGDSQFSTNQFGASFSVLKNLDHFGIQYLGGGLQLAYGMEQIDYKNLNFQDAFQNHSATAEPGNSTANFFDVSLGGFYSYALDERRSIQVGAAGFHLNEPTSSFFGNSSSKIYRKYIIHASGNYMLNPNMDLYPKFYVALQGPYKPEINFGGFVRINLDHFRTSKYGVYVGTWYRWNDALIPTLRMDINKVSVGFTYDVNVSQLKTASVSKGGPELSLIYIACGNHKKSGIECPRF